MTEYRDIPPRGLAWLTSALSISAFAAAGGFGLGFLALAFIGVAGVELAPMVWGSGVLDTMLRGTVGLVGIGLAACLGIGGLMLSAYYLAYARQLAREAEAHPTRVPPWRVRLKLISTIPFMGIYVVAGWGIGLGVLAALLFLAVAGEPSSDSFDIRLAFAIAVASVVGMIGLLVLVATVWKPAWRDAMERASAMWRKSELVAVLPPEPDPMAVPDEDQRAVGAAARRLKRIARAVARVGLASAIAGGASFLVGVWLRQPCRNCDQNSYSAPGETFVDVLMTIALMFTIVAVVVLALALLTEWVEDVVVQTGLARLARDGSPRPPDAVLGTALAAEWPGMSAGVALVVVGLGIGGSFGLAGLAAPGILPSALATVLLALGVVGVVVIAWSIGAAARSRNRLRAAWSLGDVQPPIPPVKPRRPNTR